MKAHEKIDVARPAANKTFKPLRSILLPAVVLSLLISLLVFPVKKATSAIPSDNETSKTGKSNVQSDEHSSDLGILKNIKIYLGNGEYQEATILFIDPEQLASHHVPLILGDSKHVFDSEKSVLISERAANLIFDHKHPNCLLMECDNARVSCNLKITGIIRDPVKYFGMPVDYIVSKKLLNKIGVH